VAGHHRDGERAVQIVGDEVSRRRLEEERKWAATARRVMLMK
jgi:hypothetical protein